MKTNNKPQPYQGVPLEQYLEVVAMKDKLEKENQELKDKLSKIVYEKLSEAQRIISALAKQEQYFLEVIESVLKEHYVVEMATTEDAWIVQCNCFNDKHMIEYSSFWEHLLQEIKSAMEKGKDDC